MPPSFLASPLSRRPVRTRSYSSAGGVTATARLVAPVPDLEEATLAELQRAMSSGRLTSFQLTRRYLQRIEALDRRGPELNSIIEVNPQALDIARSLDGERRRGEVRGPLLAPARTLSAGRHGEPR